MPSSVSIPFYFILCASLLSLCALVQKFKAQGQWTGAVNMLVGARCFRDAADLCAAHGVPLTDDLAEKLSPEKGTVDEEERLATLRRVAKAARKQGAFQLAAKKYAQVCTAARWFCA